MIIEKKKINSTQPTESSKKFANKIESYIIMLPYLIIFEVVLFFGQTKNLPNDIHLLRRVGKNKKN